MLCYDTVTFVIICGVTLCFIDIIIVSTVEKCDPTDVKDRAQVILGPETPKVTQWKQDFFRRRVLAAEIYSRCVDDCNLLFYLSGNYYFLLVCV